MTARCDLAHSRLLSSPASCYRLKAGSTAISVAACRARKAQDAVTALTSHLAAARDFVLDQMPDDE